MTTHSSITELYLKYPEHFKSGVQNAAEIEVYQKITDAHPEFQERFPSGRNAKEKTQDIPMQTLIAKFQAGR